METSRAETPVFTDESGRRATRVQWAARGLCACLVLLGATVGVTLATHVPLPGLGGIAPTLPGTAREAAREATEGGENALDAGLTERSDSNTLDASVAVPATGAREKAARGTGDVAARVSTPRPVSSVGAASAVQGAVGPGEGSGSVRAPAPQATAAASPAAPDSPASSSNANPRATAKSANSTARATPQTTTRSKNPRATAASSNGQASAGPTSTPPGWTK